MFLVNKLENFDPTIVHMVIYRKIVKDLCGDHCFYHYIPQWFRQRIEFCLNDDLQP